MGTFAPVTLQSGGHKQLQDGDTLVCGYAFQRRVGATAANYMMLNGNEVLTIGIGRSGQTARFYGNLTVDETASFNGQVNLNSVVGTGITFVGTAATYITKQTSTGIGNAFIITAGAGAAGNNAGGATNLVGGEGTGSGTGGAVTATGGASTGSGTGGAITLVGGASSTGTAGGVTINVGVGANTNATIDIGRTTDCTISIGRSGRQVDIYGNLTMQAGTTLATTSTGNINLPNNVNARFKIESTSVGSTVTAGNLDTLTNGSSGVTLHTHPVSTGVLSQSTGRITSNGSVTNYAACEQSMCPDGIIGCACNYSKTFSSAPSSVTVSNVSTAYMSGASGSDPYTFNAQASGIGLYWNTTAGGLYNAYWYGEVTAG